MPPRSPIQASASTVAVFGSSRSPEQSAPYAQARQLGAALAAAGFAIASGGYGGLMEAVSRGAAEAGGKVIGVAAASLSRKTNRWVQQEIVVETWDQRLFRLLELGDGYVACPGETGTLVELAVAWEMMSKGLLPRKPLVALGNYWLPVIELIQRAMPQAPAEGGSRDLVRVVESVPEAVSLLRQELLQAPEP